jgi:methyltransferase (TIGR00027 family)
LERSATRESDAGILYLSSYGSEEFQTYAALVTEARRALAGLRERGLKPGDKLLFQFDRPADFLPAFCACILGGFVAVPFSVPAGYDLSSHPVRLMHKAWRQFQQPAFFTSARLAELLTPFVKGKFGPEARVLELDDLRRGGSDDRVYRGQAEDLAVLSLTSGSTGDPKIVALTHDNIIQNIAGSAEMARLTPEDNSLNWLRLEHVAVLVRCCLRDIYIGNRQIQAPLEAFRAEPLVFLDWLHRYGVTFAALPNFAMALINQHLEETRTPGTWDLSAVRSIISVAEPVVPRTARTFHTLLKPYGLSHDRIHSGWGMSETAGTVTFSESYLTTLSDEDTCVDAGVPMPNFSLRIVDDNDRIVEEGVTGHVQAKGPMVSGGYFGNSELNRDAYAEGGWLRTGDLGVLRKGRLTITGRDKDVIIINGQNHSCREIEAAIEELEGVEASNTVACAMRSPGDDTDQCVVYFSPRENSGRVSTLCEEIRRHVVRRMGFEPSEVLAVERNAIPRTSRGKVDRLELRRRLERSGIDAIDHIGQTAFNVAQWRVEECEQAAPFLSDHIANIFVDERRVRTARMVDRISPATKFLVTYRAKVFDDELLAHMERGTEQVVILGAGLDTRAIRLGRGTTRFFEIDKKEVCAFKTETLELRGYQLQSQFVPCDYTADDFIQRLVDQGFDRRKATWFLWEGNSMYLKEEHIRSVLTTIRENVDSCEISFDYLTRTLLDRSKHDSRMDGAKAFDQLDAPWITGFDDIEGLANDVGHTVERNVRLIDHLREKEIGVEMDPRLFEDYYFCTMRPAL